MLYAIVSANTVTQYPAYPPIENPNVSFPSDWTGGTIGNTEYVVVVTTSQPSINVLSQTLAEVTPTYNAGLSQWEQTWQINSLGEIEAAAIIAQYEAVATQQANNLLAISDTFVIQAIEASTGLSNDFITYRSDLLQPSALPGYPVDTVFPTLPNTIFDNTAPLPGNYVIKSGDTMTGELDMGFYNIVGLADPNNPQDAAHKQYVDNTVATAIANVSGGSTNTDAQYTWTNTHTFNNTVTLNGISANGSTGTAYQVLTSNGSDSYWGSINGLSYTGTGVGAWTGNHTYNGQVTFANSVALNGTTTVAAVSANGSVGTDGQVLTSNGSKTYWSTVSGGGSVNTAESYTWTNTQNFNWPVNMNGNPLNFGTSSNITIGNNYGSAGQVLTSNGTSGMYWSTVSGGGTPSWILMGTLTSTGTINFPSSVTFSTFASTYKEIIIVIYNAGGTTVTSVLPLATVASYPVTHTVYGNVSGSFGSIGNYSISGSSATSVNVSLETLAPGPWSAKIFYR